MRTHLRLRSTAFDGEYDMTGDGRTVLELTAKITEKAKKMLNPFNKTDVQFSEEWKYYKGNKSMEAISVNKFKEMGGTFDYIVCSSHAGGNRLEIGGGVIKDVKMWVLNGHVRFS
ncbi:MAG: hypothetical protein M1556_01340 [Candidatus Thermoplasmatota archaeon]|nr:hypothetical protein [Candidatus Thermoplasmatota archaeon]MCL6002279.1 hypothetical protein [Candidatus Thermoplasmatota archaeon]